MRIGGEGWLGMLGDRYVNSDFWQSPFLTKTARTGPPTRYVPSGPGLTTPAGGTDKMRRSLHKLWEFSHPDVAEAEWLAFVAMGLEFDRGAVELFIERLANVACLAFQFEVVVDYHPV